VLNVQRLRILREVAARGTITAAAESLYLTPPAVSRQLMVLEKEVGVALVERGARSIRLTEAGHRLVEHAEKILADCEAAQADVASFAREVSGTLRISMFQTAAQSLGLPAIVALRRDYPLLKMVIHELESITAIDALKAGQLDIALSHEWDFVPLPRDPGIERFDLFTEPISVILQQNHPLANGPVRLIDLADEPWCVAKETTASRQAVARVTRSVGFEPDVIFESNYFRAIGSAVEAGLGVGVAPAMTDLRGLDIVIQPLVEPSMSRRVFAAVRKGSSGSPAMQAVLDALSVAGDAAQHVEPAS